jgi:hypothetical protein
MFVAVSRRMATGGAAFEEFVKAAKDWEAAHRDWAALDGSNRCVSILVRRRMSGEPFAALRVVKR